MPRHLISDAHEWINEIPTVPIYYLANQQPRYVVFKCFDSSRRDALFSDLITSHYALLTTILHLY